MFLFSVFSVFKVLKLILMGLYFFSTFMEGGKTRVGMGEDGDGRGIWEKHLLDDK